MILLTWRPASSGWPCTKSCLTNSPRLFSGNSTEPSYQRGSPKLRLVKWPKQRHNLPASLKRHNLDIICETEHLVSSFPGLKVDIRRQRLFLSPVHYSKKVATGIYPTGP